MTSRSDPHGAVYDLAVRAHRRALWSGLDQSSVMGFELLSGILVWTGIGWLLDRWLGTAPWLLCIGAMVGFAAGLYLVWVRASRMEGYTAAKPGPDDGVLTPGGAADA